jgi:hypothetical protein
MSGTNYGSGTITAANSVVTLVVLGLYNTPQQLQGYAADDVFDTDAVEPAEIVMGVDGRMSAGWVPYTTKQKYSIMPDSPSSVFFETWLAAQNAQRELYFANGNTYLPAVSRSYVMTRGVLSNIQAIAPAKKVLQMRTFEITWSFIAPSNI